VSLRAHEYLIVAIFALTFTGLGMMLARVWWGWR